MSTSAKVAGSTTAHEGLPVAVFAPVPDTLSASATRNTRAIKIIRPPTFSFATLLAGLATLIQYCELLYTLSVFRLTVRYKQSLLGWAWAALQPLALMGIYTIIFTRVTKVATGGIPYPIFVLSALLPWTFFSSSVINAVSGLTAYPNLLTKMYFPREIIPFSYLAAGFADFCIASAILGCFLFHYRIALTWKIVYALPIIVFLTAFVAAMALFLSALQVRFRDVGLAMPLLLQVWMFTTPVVYSLQSVPARFRTLYLLDPVAGLIESFRSVVVGGTRPDLAALAYSGGIALACFVLGYMYFKSCEATMADII
ncbi:MAG TPA: ABC transporter permease [Terriglobales bacterium]